MKHIDSLLQRYPSLFALKNDIIDAYKTLKNTYEQGGKLLICGNGGSSADAEHIVGEMMKGFLLRRKMDEKCQERFQQALGEEAQPLIEKLQCGIPALSLPSQSAVLSAFINDVDPELMYAQMVFGYGQEHDLLIGLSTSGNARNVTEAAKVAKALGIRSLALTGQRESRLSAICDCTIQVPETETFKIQELHLPVYHYLCAAAEQSIFG